jgi:DNA-binding MarR family transcriptional regulator
MVCAFWALNFCAKGGFRSQFMPKARRQRPNQEQRRRRAWETFLDLADAVDRMREQLRIVLEMFGLSMEEFRLLALLYLRGPLTLRQASEERGRNRKNMYHTLRLAEEYGWVHWEVSKVGAEDVKKGRLPKDRRGGNTYPPRMGTVKLTSEGERLIGTVLPRQQKVAEALLRPLDGRERVTLSQICRKLREEQEIGRLTVAAALIRAERDDG